MYVCNILIVRNVMCISVNWSINSLQNLSCYQLYDVMQTFVMNMGVMNIKRQSRRFVDFFKFALFICILSLIKSSYLLFQICYDFHFNFWWHVFFCSFFGSKKSTNGKGGCLVIHAGLLQLENVIVEVISKYNIVNKPGSINV